MFCEVQKPIEAKMFQSDVYYNTRRIAHGHDLEIANDCMPPCLTMSTTLKRIYFLSNGIKHASARLESQNNVEILTDVYSYDLFNLVVDLGSALGLWVGLSALSIFDNILEFLRYTKSKYSHYH